MGKKFKIADDNNSKTLDKDEFEKAIENFKEYYKNASPENVQVINLYRKGYVKNMMIISNY